MTELTRGEMLKRLCHPTIAGLMQPSAVVVGGETYAVSANDAAIVAIKNDSRAMEYMADNFVRKTVQRMSPPTVDTVATTVARLREWSGEPAWNFPCEECNGSGKLGICPECDGDGHYSCTCSCGDEHSSECEECDGTGKGDKQIDCDACAGDAATHGIPTKGIVAGHICGSDFDLRRMARLLAVVGDGACNLWMASRDMLSIRGDGWHICLMRVQYVHGSKVFIP